jgi:MSHA biogenesis protein MshP
MKHYRAQQGFAAIAAIFLVVGLAALGAFMVSMSNTQQLTSAQDVQGSRAYWAARAGLEWGVAKAKASSCATSTAISTIDPAFSVTVTCSSAAYTTDVGLNPPTTPTIYQIKAVAQSSGSVGGVGYIERSVSTAVEM